MPAKDDPVVIKKYANRRLYNTGTSTYVTLEDLAEMVKRDEEFVVQDAKTGEDITHSVLTQIIFELENAKTGQNMLPISFLRQLISFYGHGMGWMVPGYLEQMMQSFTGNQEAMAKAMQDAMGGSFPMRGIEEMSKQNMAMFERAMQMFSPFQGQGPSGSASGRNHSAGTAPSGASTPSEAPADAGAQLDSLREQVELLRQQLDKLSDEKDGKKE